MGLAATKFSHPAYVLFAVRALFVSAPQSNPATIADPTPGRETHSRYIIQIDVLVSHLPSFREKKTSHLPRSLPPNQEFMSIENLRTFGECRRPPPPPSTSSSSSSALSSVFKHQGPSTTSMTSSCDRRKTYLLLGSDLTGAIVVSSREAELEG